MKLKTNTLLLAALSVAALCQAEPERPNIIIIMTITNMNKAGHGR